MIASPLLTLACSQNAAPRTPETVAQRKPVSDTPQARASSAQEQRSNLNPPWFPALDTVPAVFVENGSPGEGRPVLEAVTGVLTLRTEPVPTAPIAHVLRLTVGQRVTYDGSLYETVVPGILRPLAPTQQDVVILGPITGRERAEDLPRSERALVEIDTTMTVELLMELGEGYCYIRVDGLVMASEMCPSSDSERFELVRPPAMRWWLRLVAEYGRKGWVMVNDSTVRVVDMTF